MYFGPLNTKVTLKNFFMEAFSRYQCSKLFFNFQSCSDVFEYISSSNWPIRLNKYLNWRQLNPLQLFILKFSDQPSSSDISDSTIISWKSWNFWQKSRSKIHISSWDNFENWKKNLEHWYLENASIKIFLSVSFVFSRPKYMKKSY